MKKVICLLLLFGISAGYLTAETLTVRIENIDAGKGHLMIGLFNDEETFPDETFQGKKVPASDKIMTVSFTDLPKGQYAVSIYQDSNDNGELDKVIFGIPVERYGFSNNSDKRDYGKNSFDLAGDMTITIRLR